MKKASEFRDRYLEHLEIKNYAPRTVQAKRSELDRFVNWLSSRGIDDLEAVTEEQVFSYQKYLSRYRKANGEPIVISNQIKLLHAVRAFFEWLMRQNYILRSPALNIEMPKTTPRELQEPLNHQELDRVFTVAASNKNEALGLRDSAMVELMYATAMRREETCNLRLENLDMQQRLVWIKQGKGRKDGVGLFGEKAYAALSQYLERGRPRLENFKSDSTLFLTMKGAGFSPKILGRHIRRLLDYAGIKKAGSCHILRRTFAVHMLEAGVDSRLIGEFLRHESTESVKAYLKIDRSHLRRVMDEKFGR